MQATLDMSIRWRFGAILAASIILGAVPAIAKDSLLPVGELFTHGNQIVSGNGKSVRILSVGVFTDVSGQVGNIVAAGFNTIRVEWGNRELGSDVTKLDRIVDAARRVGLKVILDDHFNEGVNAPCFAQQANGLWLPMQSSWRTGKG
jgi:hypothetical protein